MAAPTVAAASPSVITALAAASEESAASQLSRHVRTLAAQPRNLDALIGAGRAALEVGDVPSAAAFFGRADEVSPNDWRPKAGMGAAVAQMGDAAAALSWFDIALRQGATQAMIGADRGIAYDLMGQQGLAQADYRAAAAGPVSSDEVARRLALSLAISGDRKAAIQAIQSQLNQRVVSAQRVRAFVLAMTGDQKGARDAIEAAMPGSGSRIEPFLVRLARLRPDQKAFAVHLGIFPEQGQEFASAAPPPAPVSPRPSSRPPAAPPVIASRPEPVPAPVAIAPKPPGPPAQLATRDERDDRLSGIDRLLSEIPSDPAPDSRAAAAREAERAAAAKKAREERAAAAKKLADRKLAEAKKAAEEKARKDKQAAEKKAKEEAEKLGVKGTYFVQLAGGSNEGNMAREYKKLSGKSSQLKRRDGLVTKGKGYFRLLVGPFDDKADAQAFVNKLGKDGVDAFAWTRSPAQIRIEKLP